MRYETYYDGGWKTIDKQTGKHATVQDIATAYNKLERQVERVTEELSEAESELKVLGYQF